MTPIENILSQEISRNGHQLTFTVVQRTSNNNLCNISLNSPLPGQDMRITTTTFSTLGKRPKRPQKLSLTITISLRMKMTLKLIIISNPKRVKKSSLKRKKIKKSSLNPLKLKKLEVW